MSKDSLIFVTGGTGFVGSYLLRYLVKEGYSNIRASRRPSSSFLLVNDVAEKIEWVEGDILDVPFLEEAMKDVQVVFHCAASVSFDDRDEEELMLVNETGTANMVNLAIDAGVRHFIHVSSIAAIGRLKNGQVINEQTAWQRSSLNTRYAISKYLAEMQVWRGIAEGLNAMIVNPSVVLGGCNWSQGTGQLFKRIAGGIPFYPSGGNGFVDVRDVARFMILAMKKEISGKRIILSAENLKYKTVFEKIAEGFQMKRPRFRISRGFGEIAWRLDWLRSLLTGSKSLFTRESAVVTSRTFNYDNSESMKVEGFTYIPIDKTIADTVKCFNFSLKEGKPGSSLPLPD